MEPKDKPISLVAIYHCRICGTPFEAPQGSRRYLCDKHLLERVRAGGKQTPKA